MKSALPKVLHPLAGRPMLSYVLEACFEAGVGRSHVVVGHHKDKILETFGQDARLSWIEQAEQLGTGHAVMVCRSELGDFDGDILVIAGDMPLVRPATLRDLLAAHRAAGAAVSLATAELDDPGGYGRVVRDPQGHLLEIVEDVDCTQQQREINEVNISYYCFDARALFDSVRKIQPHNAKAEYYITDAVNLLVAEQRPAAILPGVPPEDALGINSQEQLTTVEALMQRRLTPGASN